MRPPQKTGVSGTDTTEESAAAVQAAQQLACQCGCAVLVTGAVDYVTDGERLLALANGDPLMTRVTGVGCAMGALAAACVAAAPDAFTGAAACAAILGIAGERAAARSRILEASLLPCWMSWMPLRLLMRKNLPEFYENR